MKYKEDEEEMDEDDDEEEEESTGDDYENFNEVLEEAYEGYMKLRALNEKLSFKDYMELYLQHYA